MMPLYPPDILNQAEISILICRRISACEIIPEGTKTVYNYIDKGIFRDITNKDLWVKNDGKRKRDYKKIRRVTLNNKTGKSITERPKEADNRSEQDHWDIDLVVGKQGTKPVILTLVECKTRRLLYILVKNKTQKKLYEQLKRLESALEAILLKPSKQ